MEKGIIQLTQCSGPRGGTRDYKWQRWSNGAKSQDPKKSFGLPAKPKKIPGPKINSQKNPLPILWALKVPKRGNAITQRTAAKHICLYTLFAELHSQTLPILPNIPKKSLLKSSYPKKYLPNFRTQKNPKIENFKPKKILWSSPSLEIQSTPPPPGAVGWWNVLPVRINCKG